MAADKAQHQHHTTLTVRSTAQPSAEAPPAATVAAESAGPTAASPLPPELPVVPSPGEFAVSGDDELLSEGEEEGEAQAVAAAAALPVAAAERGSPAQAARAAAAQLHGSDASEASEASIETLSDAPAVRPRALLLQSQRASAGVPPAGMPSGQAALCSPTGAAAPTSSVPALGQVAGMLRELDGRIASLAGRVARQERAEPAARAATAVVPTPVLPCPAAERLAVAEQPAATAAAAHQEAPQALLSVEPPAVEDSGDLEPSSALAAPARNTSLLLAQRAQQLEAQVGGCSSQ